MVLLAPPRAARGQGMNHYAPPALFGARQILGKIRRTCKIVCSEEEENGGTRRCVWGRWRDCWFGCPSVILGKWAAWVSEWQECRERDVWQMRMTSHLLWYMFGCVCVLSLPPAQLVCSSPGSFSALFYALLTVLPYDFISFVFFPVSVSSATSSFYLPYFPWSFSFLVVLLLLSPSPSFLFLLTSSFTCQHLSSYICCCFFVSSAFASPNIPLFFSLFFYSYFVRHSLSPPLPCATPSSHVISHPLMLITLHCSLHCWHVSLLTLSFPFFCLAFLLLLIFGSIFCFPANLLLPDNFYSFILCRSYRFFFSHNKCMIGRNLQVG